MTSKEAVAPDVQPVFDNYPPAIRQNLMALRALILAVAAEIDGVGDLEETLKWGQPSYLTAASRSGTTVRIDQVRDDPGHYALFVNCQTSLVESWRTMYPALTYDGNRAIVFSVDEKLPTDAVKDCIGMALTYHRRKRHHAAQESAS